jgi:hypothetical protein
MIYFDSDMSKSTNTVVYFDWKRGIQNSKIEGQKTLMPKEKGQTTIYKTIHRNLQIGQHKPHQKNQGRTQVLRKGKHFLLH